MKSRCTRKNAFIIRQLTAKHCGVFFAGVPSSPIRDVGDAADTDVLDAVFK